MCTTRTAPAEAYSPDADRAGPAAFAPPPEWLIRLLVLLIMFLIEHVRAFRERRRRPGLPSWWITRPDMAPGSTQELAASVRGSFGTAIAVMCRQWGIGPGHKDWAYVSRTILAFGGSLQGLDGRKHPQPWWETPEIVPGMIRADTDAKPTAASLLAGQIAADAQSPVPNAAPTCAKPICAEPICAERAYARPVLSPAFWWLILARTGTGPPIGPPLDRDRQFYYV
jgi:hypothetical protein